MFPCVRADAGFREGKPLDAGCAPPEGHREEDEGPVGEDDGALDGLGLVEEGRRILEGGGHVLTSAI